VVFCSAIGGLAVSLATNGLQWFDKHRTCRGLTPCEHEFFAATSEGRETEEVVAAVRHHCRAHLKREAMVWVSEVDAGRPVEHALAGLRKTLDADHAAGAGSGRTPLAPLARELHGWLRSYLKAGARGVLGPDWSTRANRLKRTWRRLAATCTPSREHRPMSDGAWAYHEALGAGMDTGDVVAIARSSFEPALLTWAGGHVPHDDAAIVVGNVWSSLTKALDERYAPAAGDLERWLWRVLRQQVRDAEKLHTRSWLRSQVEKARRTLARIFGGPR
jgi:hypothetical protein